MVSGFQLHVDTRKRMQLNMLSLWGFFYIKYQGEVVWHPIYKVTVTCYHTASVQTFFVPALNIHILQAQLVFFHVCFCKLGVVEGHLGLRGVQSV